MGRMRATLALIVASALLAACSSGGSNTPSGPLPKGTAITVNSDKLSAAQLVSELRIIAANDKLARALKKDDITLVPKAGTIAPELSQEWVDTLVNQVVVDRELAKRGLKVSPKERKAAAQQAATLFRGSTVFNAFPPAFRKLVTDRQQRIDALRASLPATAEPTDAELAQLFAQVQQTCKGDKLFAQIVLASKAEAEAVGTQLAQGADYATLARTQSKDPFSAPLGGVFACDGAPRFNASTQAVQQTARNLPIGAVSPPVASGSGGYAVLKALPLTLSTARGLLAADWHVQHPSPFFDFLVAQRLASSIEVAPQFGIVQRSPTTVGIYPPKQPVKL